MALYDHLIRQPQIHMLDQLLVLDEAWRVVEPPFLTPLMREGRAFGLGVVIASQFPRDRAPLCLRKDLGISHPPQSFRYLERRVSRRPETTRPS